MLSNLNLTDMENCYKVFKSEIIKSIKLDENRFGFEPEITAKLAKKKCRIYEVGVKYYGRTYEQGKKIGWKDVFFDNISALLSNCWKLRQHASNWQQMQTEWLEQLGRNQILESPHPLSAMAVASNFFFSHTGRSFESCCENELARVSSATEVAKMHRHLYKIILQKDLPTAKQEFERRLTSSGLLADRVLENISQIPASTPVSQRMFLFKHLLNGIPTSRRLRFITGRSAFDCCFCNAREGDCQAHWADCAVLLRVCAELYGQGTEWRVMTHDSLFLQRRMDGNDMQRMLAFWHAAWRVRCAHVSMQSQPRFEDAVAHFRNIIDDPWLLGNPVVLDRQQRRSARRKPPAELPGWWVYNSDGASRARPDERLGSYGVQLARDGQIECRYAVFVGDETNNVTEYMGVIEALKHATGLPADEPLCFRVDSKLLAEQLNGRWACRCEHLRPLYEHGLSLLGRLRSTRDFGKVTLEHVYREFNAGADALANLAIDAHDPRLHRNGVVTNESWS